MNVPASRCSPTCKRQSSAIVICTVAWPNDVIEYLTLVELLAIHHRLIEDFGGASGLRDGGALESALFRPQTGYYRDVIQEAAAAATSGRR